MDSNHRRRKPADLQSAPFGHSGNYPFHCGRYILTLQPRSSTSLNSAAKVGIIFKPANNSMLFFRSSHVFL